MGGAVIAIVAGMAVTVFLKEKRDFAPGITFTFQKDPAVGSDPAGIWHESGCGFPDGKQSLPIIVCTITTSLVIAFALHKAMDIPPKISTLVGVGSSICGGSAIAATAPVIDADDEEVAQAISVIFFFNVLAAILFPVFGQMIGFDTTSGEAFGILREPLSMTLHR